MPKISFRVGKVPSHKFRRCHAHLVFDAKVQNNAIATENPLIFGKMFIFAAKNEVKMSARQINPVAFTYAEWQLRQITPFYKNVMREGVRLCLHRLWHTSIKLKDELT